MSLASQVTALADRVADEFNTLRATITGSLAGKVDTTRTITAGTGLTGGGDLSANRTLTVAYGTSSTTAAVGNDARLSDTRTPTDGSVTDAKVNASAAIAETKLSLASDAAAGTASRRTLGTGSTQAAAGNHTHSYAPTSRTISTTAPLTGGGDLSADRTLAITTGTTSGTVALGDHTHTPATPATQTGVTGAATVNCQTSNVHALTLSGNVTGLTISGTPYDGQRLVVEAWSPTSSRTLTHGLARMTGLDTVLTIGANQVCLLGLYYSTRATRWVLASFNEEA